MKTKSAKPEIKSTQTAAVPRRTHIDLVPEQRAKICALMNSRLADAIDLEAQMKQAHWNVKGPNFIGLHELFDKIYASVEDYVDLIAERIVQLGGIAQGTVRISAARTKLKEYPHTISDGVDHVDAVVEALSTFAHEVRESIDEADDLGDKDAADIFTEVSRGIDKWLWFVEAHIQAKN